MTVRKLEQRDYRQHSEVSSMAYAHPIKCAEGVIPNGYGAFDDDGRELAELQVGEFQTAYGGIFLPTAGVGGVASRPESRRHGAVRALFEELEREAPERGWVLGMLAPFSYGYYRKFGYDRVARCVSLTVPFTELASVPRDTAELWEGGDTAELCEFYNRLALRTDMMMRRDDGRYFISDPYERQEYNYLWRFPDGKLGGLLRYSVDRRNETVNVEEFLYENRQALYGLLGFLRSYDGQEKKVVFSRLPFASPLLSLLPDFNSCRTEFRSCRAGRIYNLEAVLASHDYPSEPGRFTILSRDAMPQNAGLFTVEYGGGKAMVSRGAGEPCAAISAGAAARIMLGGEYLTSELAAYIPGFEPMADVSALLRAFPPHPTAQLNGF